MSPPDMPASTIHLQDQSRPMNTDSTNEMWHVSEKVCIYRVPKSIKLSKPQSYTPFVVALGPYHHAKPEFSGMNSHKMEAVNRMLRRIKKTDMNILTSKIQRFERKIRECYEEQIYLNGEELSCMLTMDACFILEFLRAHDRPEYFSLVFGSNNTVSYAIFRDIMKLENQIPLFILLALLELEFQSSENAKEQLATMLSKWKRFTQLPFSNENASESELKRQIERQPPPCHLLDLSRMLIKDLLLTTRGESSITIDSHEVSIGSEDGTTDRLQQLSCINDPSTPSAYSLVQAGIEFRPGKLGFEKRMWGKSILSLPQVGSRDSTEALLRNLIAYEECQFWSWPRKETIITQVVILLQFLISSERDVSILRKSNVFKTMLISDKDTAHMFNNLGNKYTFASIPQIQELKHEAREHYNRRSSRWNVWIRQLEDEYFSTPWSLISFLAALLVLFLTAVQAWYAWYAFMQGRHK